MRSHIDSVSLVLTDEGGMEFLDDFMQAFERVGRLDFTERTHGKNHYEFSGVISCRGAAFAEVFWGGDRQRNTALIMMKGLGCQLVNDWLPPVTHLSSLPKCKVSRLDVALDIFDRSLTLEHLWSLRKDNSMWRFTPGRPPKFTPIGDMTEAGDDGRTLYIGTRDSDMYGRAYEKGMQLFAKSMAVPGMNVRDVMVSLDTKCEPFKVGDYLRFEVEFKAKTTELTLPMLLKPDSLIAGAYPVVAKYLQIDKPTKRLRVENAVMNDLDAMLKLIKKQWGPTILTGLDKYGPHELMCRILGNHRNQRLIEKGILLAKIEDAPQNHTVTALL